MKIGRMVGWIALIVGIVLLFLTHGDTWGLLPQDYLSGIFYGGIWWVAWLLVAILLTVGLVGVVPQYFGAGEFLLPMNTGRNSIILLVVIFIIVMVYHGYTQGIWY